MTVCTGNVCRSPLAERLLARQLECRGVTAEVSSAGLVADGMPAAPEIVALLGEHGLDGSAHQSRILTADMMLGADLVLGMAREHVREAVLLDPGLFGRCFTLKELVRRGRALGPRRRGESLAGWLAQAGEGRLPADTLGSSRDDDIVDPIGRRRSVFRDVGAEIATLTADLADLAWPVAPGGPASA